MTVCRQGIQYQDFLFIHAISWGHTLLHFQYFHLSQPINMIPQWNKPGQLGLQAANVQQSDPRCSRILDIQTSHPFSLVSPAQSAFSESSQFPWPKRIKWFSKKNCRGVTGRRVGGWKNKMQTNHLLAREGKTISHLSAYCNENQRWPSVSGWVVRSYKKRNLKMHLKYKILFLREKKKSICVLQWHPVEYCSVVLSGYSDNLDEALQSKRSGGSRCCEAA